VLLVAQVGGLRLVEAADDGGRGGGLRLRVKVGGTSPPASALLPPAADLRLLPADLRRVVTRGVKVHSALRSCSSLCLRLSFSSLTWSCHCCDRLKYPSGTLTRVVGRDELVFGWKVHSSASRSSSSCCRRIARSCAASDERCKLWLAPSLPAA
jgi:hypothetical protein